MAAFRPGIVPGAGGSGDPAAAELANTGSLYVEEAMLMPVSVSNVTFRVVKGVRVKDGKPQR